VADHTAVSSLTCNSCHENNATDMASGVGASIFVRQGEVAVGMSRFDANHAIGHLGCPNDCASCHSTRRHSSNISQCRAQPTCRCLRRLPPAHHRHAAGFTGVGKSIMVHEGVTAATCTLHGTEMGPFYGILAGAGGQP